MPTESVGLRSAPRVLFVGAFPPPGGRVFGGNISDCRALLSSSFAERLDLILLDTTQQSVPAPHLVRRLRSAIVRAVRFVRLMERGRPDVVLVFASSGLSFVEKALYVAYARLRGVPGILSVRSGHFIDQCCQHQLFRWLARWLLRFPHCLLCQGLAWQRFFGATLAVPAAKCAIVESWVAGPEYLRLGEQRQGAPDADVNILFIGWVEPFKGVFELLEAVRRLMHDEHEVQIQLTIAGDGSASNDARAWVNNHGLTERVTFLGWVDGPAKLEALKDATMFVLPSHTEGLPNAMIEAMAAGLPVVVTRVGSIPDAVRDGRDGVIVEPRDVEHLTSAIRQLASAPDTCARMGRAAHLAARERFGVERAAAEIVILLQDACASCQAPAGSGP